MGSETVIQRICFRNSCGLFTSEGFCVIYVRKKSFLLILLLIYFLLFFLNVLSFKKHKKKMHLSHKSYHW